jgi:hypothetical protein
VSFSVVLHNPSPDFWAMKGVLLITQRKYPAEAYIDDRGIRFEDWGQVLEDVKRLVKE